MKGAFRIMDKEKIVLDIPALTDGAEKRIKKRFPPVSAVIAAVLAAASLILHASIVTEAFCYIKNEGDDFLFSFIIPESKISAPAEPPLPDDTTLEDGESFGDKHLDFKMITRDLSTNAEYGLSLTNETSYAPDLYQLLGEERPSPTEGEISRKFGKGSPKVLIYHTHATEGYADTYGTGFRTSDEEKNMVEIGKLITLVLRKAGIETVHLTEQFDRESWSDAYDKSNAAVRAALKEYPSIQYVIDVHRDCIGNEDSGYVRPLCKEDDCAQLMFVCGTDEGGSGHTEWRKNLTFALQLQRDIKDDNPSLMRPVNLRRASFYQDVCPSSLILECGSCANTQREAKKAALLFACSFADYIIGAPCGLSAEELEDSLCP